MSAIGSVGGQPTSEGEGVHRPARQDERWQNLVYCRLVGKVSRYRQIRRHYPRRLDWEYRAWGGKASQRAIGFPYPSVCFNYLSNNADILN